MTEICRLCLSNTLVNNNIFDEDNKIYLKILSCLPVKVTTDDVLPKKICDICVCKVDDFYQFCHKSIDSENKLHCKISGNSKSGSTNFDCDLKIYQFTSSFLQHHKNGFSVNNPTLNQPIRNAICFVSTCTQTDDVARLDCKIKQEPVVSNDDVFEDHFDDVLSDIELDVKEGVMGDIKIENTSNVKKVDKNMPVKKSTKKSKKVKPLKVKIKRKKSKFVISSNSKSDSEEDVSLVDIMKRSRKSTASAEDKLNSGIIAVIEMNDIKSEIIEDISMMEDDEEHKTKKYNGKEDTWNCCICFVKCFEKEEMLSHYRIHYSTKDLVELEQVAPEIVQNESGDSKEIYRCLHCNTESESKASHVRHLKSHGLDKPYRCSLCEKTFRNATEILKHGKNAHKYDGDIHETGGRIEGEDCSGPMRSTKRFMCDLCDETFVYMKYVQIHRNLHHPEARGKQFVNRCLHCSREFAHLNSLRRHLRSHSGEKNFLCYICGKSLSSREHLKFHIRIHTGFKPHICKVCGKGFVKKCNLTLHERVHSGEKPHVCSHCGKAFSQRSTLVIHERYHSGSRPYVCSICNKGFVAKGLLSMHLKTSCI